MGFPSHIEPGEEPLRKAIIRNGNKEIRFFIWSFLKEILLLHA